ncbi:hypothetical protein GDO78_018029 [Eleutherodactylus coqui]|uniref:Uncharacterized protein n=1 Tax=Eleutherodactylus coqui TaxID=57060 RepID=A0A8J6E5R6_ELECQ|nr:hypothetical protein GDO78_018029 [Eleutherodactylus coqui]
MMKTWRNSPDNEDHLEGDTNYICGAAMVGAGEDRSSPASSQGTSETDSCSSKPSTPTKPVGKKKLLLASLPNGTVLKKNTSLKPSNAVSNKHTRQQLYPVVIEVCAPQQASALR